jgi:hypothetical protein
MIRKHELQKVISGNGEVRFGADIQAIAAYLKGKEGTIQEAKK